MFFADVAYTYHVGDADLTGSRIGSSDREYNIRDGALQDIDGLTVGSPVGVFYNPANSRQSVLRPGVGFQEYAVFIAPIMMLSMGILLVRGLWRTR